MLHWLRSLIKTSAPKPDAGAVLNDGLELAMDWGENWLAPIQDRLSKRHAHLRLDELDEINAACQAAMTFGHETAYAMVRARGADASEPAFAAALLACHPWVSEGNAARLFKQSLYYAWKTGGPADST